MHGASKTRIQLWADAYLPDIIAALRRGEEPEGSDAARELTRRFEPMIRKYWRAKRCGEYQDFFQDVMVRLFESLSELRDPRAFPGYFRRMVSNCAADYWRRERKHAENLKEDAEIEAFLVAFDADMTTALVVRTYLEWLSVREREVLELKYLEDLDVPEIARKLGVSEGAVRTTESRARRRLQERIEEDSRSEEKSSAR